MTTGDLVRPAKSEWIGQWPDHDTGIIIGWKGSDPVVFWNDKFFAEIEYKSDLVVVSESR